jgi:predicted phage baseplate assembly protein
VRVPGDFRPWLAGTPLTYRAPLAPDAPVARALVQDPRAGTPALVVTSTRPWTVRPDLLASGPNDAVVVVEVDDDGRGRLRFGNDVLGRAPEAGEVFRASYRIGNGPAGNVGIDAISHLVLAQPPGGDPVHLRVRNPLPASGGIAPEPVSDVKAFAPAAFRRVRQRAVTPADYAELAQRDNAATVQRAAADLRWTGSWYEMHVAVDALGQPEAGADLVAAVDRSLQRYRRILHDLRVEAAVEVPLDVAMTICVADHHRRAEVVAGVADRLSSRVLPDSTRGFFHPDRLTFGEGIYVSQLVAEAAAVTGVDNVVVTRLQRLGEPDGGALDTGVLPIATGEIARLDNDPSFPEHGILQLDARGGL